MPLTHHPLVKEFPEYKEQIHNLKMTNNHFSKLMKEYEEVDKHIFRIESDEEPTGDEYIRDLKKQRLKIKDELHSIIKES
jgi:hypothetical protein